MSDYLQNFYKQFNIPNPTSALPERQQRRYAWRNERTLYRRKCDLTGKEIVAMYPENVPFPVYSPDAWYSDGWDPLSYGRDFDFDRPFFDQFFELQKKVPRIGNILSNTVNCDYCNIVGDSKNCYLIFGSVYCEDCLYGNPYYSKDCIDSLVVRNSELCYECVDCEKLYECFYCQDCLNSRNLWFCYDTASSEDCFLCASLRHGKYQILNEKYTKEEYEKKVEELKKKDPQELRRMLTEFRLKTPVKYMAGTNNENIYGDHVNNSRNCQNLFYGQECEDVYNSTQIIKSHDLSDCDFGEFGEFLFENSGFYKCSNLICCHWCWETSNLYYSSICTLNSRDCLGCISLKHKKYCILNKQYSKEEYENLLPKIVAHMKETGEFGKFFPVKYSPFAYNETVAFEYYPMTKEEVINKGWKWNDAAYTPPKDSEGAIKCEKSGKLFRLTPQETKFYKRYGLHDPKYHPDERHKRRLSMRNPRVIHDDNCAKCGVSIHTAYTKDSGQIVYCEKCYLEGVR